MKIAVTGGSGVVGRAVLRQLMQAGHEVRALARSAESAQVLESMGSTVLRGDVLNRADLDRLVAGCERVFHIAGVNELCVRDRERMWKVNVEASLAILDAAARAGVKRMVHTSSAVTIGEERGAVGSEESRHRGGFLSEYERSKTVAERLVFDRARDIEVVAVNPASVQGPGRSTGTGALALAAARGRLRVAVDTTFSLVDIDDCARGHLLAADQGTPGERYVLSGATLTVREAVRRLNGLLGGRVRPWFFRPSVLKATAPAIDAVFRTLGKQSRLCSESVRVLLHGHRYDGSKATRDLGLRYTPLQETLERTVSWFRAEGLIPAE